MYYIMIDMENILKETPVSHKKRKTEDSSETNIKDKELVPFCLFE